MRERGGRRVRRGREEKGVVRQFESRTDTVGLERTRRNGLTRVIHHRLWRCHNSLSFHSSTHSPTHHRLLTRCSLVGRIGGAKDLLGGQGQLLLG